MKEARSTTKPISRSSDLPVEKDQGSSARGNLVDKLQTLSGNGRKKQGVPVIPKMHKEAAQGLEALRKRQLPERFDNQVEQSEEVSIAEECIAKSHQSGQLRNAVEGEIIENTSDFHLLEEMKRKQIQKPREFNVLVAGAANLGKSSFIDAFLLRKFEAGPVIRQPTTSIKQHFGRRSQGHINFDICLIDTPGYQQHCSQEYYSLLKKEITSRFKSENIDEENQRRCIIQNRAEARDRKIHCCLFFLSGPRLSEEDCKIMNKLQRYVSIIPIIAKGDCYTLDEIRSIKSALHEAKCKLGLQWFECEEALRAKCPSKVDGLLKGKFGPAPPFVMVSSVKKLRISPTKVILGREYVWGICNAQNPQHCDFLLLYNLLLVFFSDQLIRLAAVTQQSYLKWQRSNRQNKQHPQPQRPPNLWLRVGLLGVLCGAAYFLTKGSSDK